MTRKPLKHLRALWLGLSLPGKGFAVVVLPIVASFLALALLELSTVGSDTALRAQSLWAAKTLLVISIFGFAVATALFIRDVLRRLRLIEESARCLRLEQPLSPLPLGDDEIGHLEKQLEITSEFLSHRVKHLRQSEERLQAILDQTTAVIYVKDCEGRYLFTNRHYEETFGVTRKQTCGRTDADVFPKQIASKFRENDLCVLEQGRSMQFEEIAPHQDGLHTYLSLKFPLVDANKKPYAVAGISTDISHRKELEEALRRANEELSRHIERPIRDGSAPVDFSSPPKGWIAESCEDSLPPRLLRRFSVLPKLTGRNESNQK